MIDPPRRGGTYLHCPRCPRWRTRVLRRYARHFLRVHGHVATLMSRSPYGQALAISSALTSPGAPVITHYAMNAPLPGGSAPYPRQLTEPAYTPLTADVLRDVIAGLRRL